MRIRTQNLIAIVPLFLGMASAAGAMTYSTARQEMLWGLREEASALSVSMAEFIGGEALAPDPDPHEALRRRTDSLALAFERVLRHGQAREIVLLDAAGGVLGTLPGAERPDGDPGLLEVLREGADSSALALTYGGEVALSSIRDLPGGGSVLLAFAPIEDRTGERIGILGVAVDASGIGELSRQLLLGLVRLTLLALLIGTVAALFISSLLTRNVRALSRAALEVAGGAYDRQIQIGTIQELSDLSNTFNTMSSVLKDLIERTRRTLIEGEQFRTPLDLARSYRQGRSSELTRSIGPLQVAARTVAGGHPGDLVGLLEQEGEFTLYLGRVAEVRDLDAAIRAAAAQRAIEEGSRTGPADEVIERVAGLLGLRIDLVRWRRGAEGEAVLTQLQGEAEPRTRRVALNAERSLVLHTLASGVDQGVRRWEQVFRGEGPELLVEQLARALASEAMGSVLAIGPAALAPAGGSRVSDTAWTSNAGEMDA